MNAHPHILPKTNPQSAIPNPKSQAEPLDERPRSVYELITRQMLEDLRADLNEIKTRVNTLLWLTLGAVILDFIMRLVK